MENSHSSSMTKPTSPKSEYCSEESGWTAYFQDFSNNYNNNNNNNNNIHNNGDQEEEGSLISYGSSLVSDAASYAAWKISHHRDHHQHRHTAAGPSIAAAGASRPPKKLTFKKTRTREISSDDSLEDTASSPVNSPKVGDLKRMIDMKTKHTADHFLENNSLSKRGGTLEYYSEMQGSEERSVVDNFNEPNDCIDLKERGLCLVPMSMLMNYLG